jgi:hypothetical protein
LQRWITVNGVFPDLEGIGAEINFCVGIAVKNASLLRKQIADDLIIAVVLEEGFICADNLGVFFEPLPHAGAQADDAFHPICGQKRIAQNRFCLLVNAVHTASPLHQTNDSPG